VVVGLLYVYEELVYEELEGVVKLNVDVFLVWTATGA